MSVFLKYKFILLLFIKWLLRMIDNLISGPMKQIWINLELSFKRYEFSNFLGSFEIFLNLKSIYLIEIQCYF